MNNHQHPMDEQFRSSFDGFRATPPPQLWQHIEAALPPSDPDEQTAATFDEQVQRKLSGLTATPPPSAWPRIASHLPFSLLLHRHVRTMFHIALGVVILLLLFWGTERWLLPQRPLPTNDAPTATHSPAGLKDEAHTAAPRTETITSTASPRAAVAAPRVHTAPMHIDPALNIPLAPIRRKATTTASGRPLDTIAVEASADHSPVLPVAARDVPIAARAVQSAIATTVPEWWTLPQIVPLAQVQVEAIEVTSALTGQARRSLDGVLSPQSEARVQPQGGWSVASWAQLNNTWLLSRDLRETVGPAASYAVDFGVTPGIELLYATEGRWRWSIALAHRQAGQRYREILDGQRLTQVEARYWQLPIQAQYRLPVSLAIRRAQLWATAGVQYSGRAALPKVSATLDGVTTDAPAMAPHLLADRTWGAQLGLRYERPLGDHLAMVMGAQAQFNAQRQAATDLQLGAQVGLQYRLGQ